MPTPYYITFIHVMQKHKYLTASVGVVSLILCVALQLLLVQITGKTDIAPSTQHNIFIMRILLGVAGVVLVLFPYVVWVVKRFWEWKYRDWFIPYFPWRKWLNLWPLMFLSLVLTMLGMNGCYIPWTHVLRYVIAANACLLTMLIASIVFVSTTKFVGRRWVGMLVLIPWFLLFVVEISALWQSNMRFDLQMLEWVSPASMQSFVSVWNIIYLAVMSGLCVWQFFLLRSWSASTTWRQVWRMLLLLVLVLVVSPALVVKYAMGMPFSAMQRINIESVWMDGSKYLNDPVQRFVAMLMNPPEYQIKEVLTSDEQEQAAILHTGIGHVYDAVSPLDKPIKRVILLSGESMSCSFLRKYNKQLPETITPFMDSLPTACFMRYISCAWPTDMGIAVHMTSHPNWQAMMERRYPNSMVRRLKEHGWRTVVFRSAELAFSSGYRLFKDMGFTDMYGAEWQRDRNPQYVNAWGTCDRITFSSAVEYLSSRRDEPVFMLIIPVDTHFPTGRYGWGNYGDLAYPKPPEWVESHPKSQLLTSIFRYDHDVSIFFEKLEQEGLLDESTLIILTADHAFPTAPDVEGIPGMNAEAESPIMFEIFSKQPLPQINSDALASQLATAPTLFHVLGLPSSRGWWGKSLFDPHYVAPIYSSALSSLQKAKQIDPREQEEKVVHALKDMLNIILIDSKQDAP